MRFYCEYLYGICQLDVWNNKVNILTFAVVIIEMCVKINVNENAFLPGAGKFINLSFY